MALVAHTTNNACRCDFDGGTCSFPTCGKRSRPAGFTLIELLVVIGIMSILLALLVTVIPRVRMAVYGAQTSAQLSSLSSAIQQYYNDYKAYPGPLSNNQLGSAFAPTGSLQGIAYVQYNGQPYDLLAFPNNNMGTIISTPQLGHVSGTQNLTLGLLGGLEFQTSPTVQFVYNPNDIFPDGKTPAPVGAPSLNPNNPRRQRAYIQVKRGDISSPSMAASNSADFFHNRGTNGDSFADAAGRSPTDAPIPVFLDKYPDPMPILYIRTNLGGQAIVGVRNNDGYGNQLVDSYAQSSGQTINEVPQYDLCQILDYTKSTIGVIANSSKNYHGLQGLGNANLTDTIVSGYNNAGQNAVAYLRDPNYRVDPNNPANSYDPSATNTHSGVAREKNGFILITAGPDRLYGTTDDIIFPGTLQVAQ